MYSVIHQPNLRDIFQHVISIHFLLPWKCKASMDLWVRVSIYTWKRHLVVGRILKNSILYSLLYLFTFFLILILAINNSREVWKVHSQLINTFSKRTDIFFHVHGNMWELKSCNCVLPVCISYKFDWLSHIRFCAMCRTSRTRGYLFLLFISCQYTNLVFVKNLQSYFQNSFGYFVAHIASKIQNKYFLDYDNQLYENLLCYIEVLFLGSCRI